MKPQLALLLVLAACPAPDPQPSPSSATPTPTPPFATIGERLPKDADGNTPIGTVGNEVVKLGPVTKDPVYAAARCTDLIGHCELVGHRATADCMATARRCATAEPWNEEPACCPGACIDEYARLTAAGDGDADAKVLGTTHPCFPGLLAAYCAAGGKPPDGCP